MNRNARSTEAVCITCRSTSFEEDSSTGGMICSYCGTQSQDYIPEEVDETDIVNLYKNTAGYFAGQVRKKAVGTDGDDGTAAQKLSQQPEYLPSLSECLVFYQCCLQTVFDAALKAAMAVETADIRYTDESFRNHAKAKLESIQEAQKASYRATLKRLWQGYLQAWSDYSSAGVDETGNSGRSSCKSSSSKVRADLKKKGRCSISLAFLRADTYCGCVCSGQQSPRARPEHPLFPSKPLLLGFTYLVFRQHRSWVLPVHLVRWCEVGAVPYLNLLEALPRALTHLNPRPKPRSRIYDLSGAAAAAAARLKGVKGAEQQSSQSHPQPQLSSVGTGSMCGTFRRFLGPQQVSLGSCSILFHASSLAQTLSTRLNQSNLSGSDCRSSSDTLDADSAVWSGYPTLSKQAEGLHCESFPPLNAPLVALRMARDLGLPLQKNASTCKPLENDCRGRAKGGAGGGGGGDVWGNFTKISQLFSGSGVPLPGVGCWDVHHPEALGAALLVAAKCCHGWMDWSLCTTTTRTTTSTNNSMANGIPVGSSDLRGLSVPQLPQSLSAFYLAQGRDASRAQAPLLLQQLRRCLKPHTLHLHRHAHFAVGLNRAVASGLGAAAAIAVANAATASVETIFSPGVASEAGGGQSGKRSGSSSSGSHASAEVGSAVALSSGRWAVLGQPLAAEDAFAADRKQMARLAGRHRVWVTTSLEHSAEAGDAEGWGAESRGVSSKAVPYITAARHAADSLSVPHVQWLSLLERTAQYLCLPPRLLAEHVDAIEMQIVSLARTGSVASNASASSTTAAADPLLPFRKKLRPNSAGLNGGDRELFYARNIRGERRRPSKEQMHELHRFLHYRVDLDSTAPALLRLASEGALHREQERGGGWESIWEVAADGGVRRGSGEGGAAVAAWGPVGGDGEGEEEFEAMAVRFDPSGEFSDVERTFAPHPPSMPEPFAPPPLQSVSSTSTIGAIKQQQTFTSAGTAVSVGAAATAAVEASGAGAGVGRVAGLGARKRYRSGADLLAPAGIAEEAYGDARRTSSSALRDSLSAAAGGAAGAGSAALATPHVDAGHEGDLESSQNSGSSSSKTSSQSSDADSNSESETSQRRRG